MKTDTPLSSESIRAILILMHELLHTATQDAFLAREYMEDREQNKAIGAALPIARKLQQAADLYGAMIAMHHSRL